MRRCGAMMNDTISANTAAIAQDALHRLELARGRRGAVASKFPITRTYGGAEGGDPRRARVGRRGGRRGRRRARYGGADLVAAFDAGRPWMTERATRVLPSRCLPRRRR